MLNSLNIKNVALIDSLDIDFTTGLNVLSGETGAGKSIIIDSLNFVLGKRADKSLIRYGTEAATVTAFFYIDNIQKAKEVLNDFDIENEDELYIKRTMTIDGKNSCMINGQKVTLAMLRQLTTTLVDIYGQNDTTFVLNPSSHLSILDEYGQSTINSLKEKQANIFKEYKKIVESLKQYGSLSDVAKNIDLYEYQINEIESANIEEGEEEELIQKRHKMNNSQSILASLNNSYEVINGDSDTNVISMLNVAISELNKVAEYDDNIEDLLERINSAKIDLKDVASSVSDIVESCEFDPREFDRIEKRISQIRLIRKKYGSTVEEVNNYLQDIKEKYDFLSCGEEKVKELEEDKENLFTELYNNAVKLSEARKKVGESLSKKIEKELTELGMKNTRFVAAFEPIQSIDNYSDISANGIDEMQFMFSANIGQPPKELTKIISGGELSRFMLALKNTIANLDGIETMVFDEIDTGISGVIAQVVAEKLYSISKNKQLLAITHLPQLASMADSNYLITKESNASTTKTFVKKIENEDLIEELARLIGGSTDSKFAIPHAIEMKEHANSLKK